MRELTSEFCKAFQAQKLEGEKSDVTSTHFDATLALDIRTD